MENRVVGPSVISVSSFEELNTDGQFVEMKSIISDRTQHPY